MIEKDWNGPIVRMAAPGSLPSFRENVLLGRRAVAYFRTGDVETAKRLAAELNARFPFDTWRARYPDDPDSETERNRYRSIQEALKAAGNRDHLDPDADFGVAPDDVLHENLGRQDTDNRARRDDREHRATRFDAEDPEAPGDRYDGRFLVPLGPRSGRPRY